jgi:hypothetical protein
MKTFDVAACEFFREYEPDKQSTRIFKGVNPRSKVAVLKAAELLKRPCQIG